MWQGGEFKDIATNAETIKWAWCTRCTVASSHKEVLAHYFNIHLSFFHFYWVRNVWLFRLVVGWPISNFNNDNSGVCSSLQLVCCSGFDATTTSPLRSSTGCVYRNGSTMKLRSWRFEHWTCSVCNTWIGYFVLLICLVVIICAHPHHSSCRFRHILYSHCRPAFISSCSSI